MRLKITVGLIILFIVILISGYYFVEKYNVQYIPKVTVEECGDNYQRASQMIMERNLSHYCSPLIKKSNRLSDYKIIKINAYDNVNGPEAKRNQKDSYGFVVTYNVQMYTSNDWIAGNGVLGKDGWVNEKVAFGYFHKKDNVFILDSIGTGP